ncbi:MAG: hypothetical protein IPN22_15785 [Bacteroidetes bacterium]|nr:hypothetical protein [Bacteroidota bacterium]
MARRRARPARRTTGDHAHAQFRGGRDHQDLHGADDDGRACEGNEAFTVNLSAATGGATISATAGSATGTITDDDAVPVFSIANASAAEGGQITFTVTRTGDAQAAQTVGLCTAVGTAGAADYTVTAGTLSFAAARPPRPSRCRRRRTRCTRATRASRSTQRRHRGATISATAGSATGTITDDDAVPVFSIANASATEGGQITFTVTRTGDAQAAQTSGLWHGGGHGRRGGLHGDHGHARFRGGRDHQDLHGADDDGRAVRGQRELHGQSQRRHRGATISATAGSATGTITDDDAVPVFSIANASATEGGQITFTVTRTGDAQAAQTIGLWHGGGHGRRGGPRRPRARSVRGGRDHQDLHGADDDGRAIVRGQRGFTVNLSAATGGATINATAGSATGTITDDDAVPVFSIANASATEGGQITFTVTRTGDAQAAQTVVWHGGGHGRRGGPHGDHGHAQFRGGQDHQDLHGADDDERTVREQQELHGQSQRHHQGRHDQRHRRFGDGHHHRRRRGAGVQHRQRQRDRRRPDHLHGDAHRATPRRRRRVAVGTAGAADYTATTGTLSFAAGETTKTFTVQTTTDALAGNAGFTVNLSAATGGATISATAGSATGTITDDDAVPVFSIANASATEGGQITSR